MHEMESIQVVEMIEDSGSVTHLATSQFLYNVDTRANAMYFQYTRPSSFLTGKSNLLSAATSFCQEWKFAILNAASSMWLSNCN